MNSTIKFRTIQLQLFAESSADTITRIKPVYKTNYFEREAVTNNHFLNRDTLNKIVKANASLIALQSEHTHEHFTWHLN